MSSPQPDATVVETDYMHRLGGEHYLILLRNLHAILQPRSYFEIGTLNGGSLKLAECRSIAIDVGFKLGSVDVIGKKPACHFFQMPSDAFFRDHDPAALLGGPLDLALLDGLHLFEYLLRDFSHIERYCRRNSVILLHDCLPPAIRTTTRKMNSPARTAGLYPTYWAGDVWRVVPMLRLAGERDTIRVVDDQYGTPTAAADLAGALAVMMSRPDLPELSGTYHFANRGETSWRGLAEKTLALSAASGGPSAEIVPIATAEYPTRARRPANSRLATDRVERDFGIVPRPWEEALADTLRAILPPAAAGS